MGQADIQGAGVLTDAITEGLLSMGNTKNVKPLEYLGRYLLEKAGIKNLDTASLGKIKQNPGETLAPAPSLPASTLTHHLSLTERYDASLENSDFTEEDHEVGNITDQEEKQDQEKGEKEEEIVEEVAEEIVEDLDDTLEAEDKVEEEVKKKKPTPRLRSSPRATLKPGHDTMDTLGTTGTSVWRSDEDTPSPGPLTSRNTQPTIRLTAKMLADHPEKRTPIAREILASEQEYMKCLDIVRSIFLQPLKNALGSNRAIISAHSLQTIFSDPMTLLDLSRGLVEELKGRLDTWNADQCLGDIFVKFCGKLKPYTNYLNNYPVILATIDRCVEQTPQFRAFMKRHERQPSTRMLKLQELLLLPTRRIEQYVTLLTWFQRYTPTDHADRQDLALALKTLTGLQNFVKECKVRLQRDRELIALQKRILSCPNLLEANRFLLKQLDVANLKPPSNTVVPELRVYQHIEMLGLFLFNDGLVVTRRATRHFPFETCVEYIYCFEACLGLKRLRVEDIPDSKYVRNAFRLYTPSKSWTCSTENFDDKMNWITLVEQTVLGALENN